MIDTKVFFGFLSNLHFCYFQVLKQSLRITIFTCKTLVGSLLAESELGAEEAGQHLIFKLFKVPIIH